MINIDDLFIIGTLFINKKSIIFFIRLFFMLCVPCPIHKLRDTVSTAAALPASLPLELILYTSVRFQTNLFMLDGAFQFVRTNIESV